MQRVLARTRFLEMFARESYHTCTADSTENTPTRPARGMAPLSVLRPWLLLRRHPRTPSLPGLQGRTVATHSTLESTHGPGTAWYARAWGGAAVTTFSTDPAEIQHYFDLLFPDAPPNAYVVLSGLSQGKLLSRWLSPSQIPQICGPLATQATHSDMYINLGLRHPDCTPRPETRGDNEDVYAIGGLWVDCDHNGGPHS